MNTAYTRIFGIEDDVPTRGGDEFAELHGGVDPAAVIGGGHPVDRLDEVRASSTLAGTSPAEVEEDEGDYGQARIEFGAGPPRSRAESSLDEVEAGLERLLDIVRRRIRPAVEAAADAEAAAYQSRSYDPDGTVDPYDLPAER